MSPVVNRCRISLQVRGIQPVGAGLRARSVAVTTARKAWASIDRIVARCHEVQRRTWCWSRPVSPLPAWKFSSTVQRRPATVTSVSRSGVVLGEWIRLRHPEDAGATWPVPAPTHRPSRSSHTSGASATPLVSAAPFRDAFGMSPREWRAMHLDRTSRVVQNGHPSDPRRPEASHRTTTPSYVGRTERT